MSETDLDIVSDYGLLTLGSRMKRIGEKLQADSTRIALARGAALQASQYPLLAALDRLGTASVGELATALGLAQPGITRSIGELVKLGLVRTRPGRTDARQRLVSLTARGQAEVALGKHDIWPAIEAAVADLCADFSAPLLAHLAALEAGLADRPLDQRIGAQPGTRR